MDRVSSGLVSSPSREWQRTVVWVVAAVELVLLARVAWYPRLVDYPFPGGDGLEWVTDGLALGNERLPSGGRQPLLPLVVAGLDAVGLLALLPVLLLAAGVALAPLAYALARRVAGPTPALVCGFVLLLSDLVRLTSRELMADTAAALFVGLALLAAPVDGLERAGTWWRSAGWAALAGSTQSAAGLFALVPLLPALGQGRHRFCRHLFCAFGIVGAAALPSLAWAGWVAWRGDAPLIAQAQASLFGPWPAAVPLYVLLAIGSLGLPWFVTTIAGAIGLLGERSGRGREVGPTATVGERRWLLVAALTQAMVAWGFFAVLYRWPSQRFVLYALPATVPLVASALARLEPRRVAFVGLAALLWVGAAWPRGSLGRTVLVAWPWPARELSAAIQDGRPGTLLRWQATGVGRLIASSPWVTSAAARRAFVPSLRHLPAAPRRVTMAVLLADPVEEITVRRRRRLIVQLLLGVRTKEAPMDLFPASWWGWGLAQRWASGDGQAAYLVSLEGRRHLVVAADGDGPPQECRRRASRFPDCARRVLRQRPALAGAIRRDGLVALARPPDGSFDGWLRALVLTSPSANTLVVPAGAVTLAGARPAGALLAGLPIGAGWVGFRGGSALVLGPPDGRPAPACP